LPKEEEDDDDDETPRTKIYVVQFKSFYPRAKQSTIK
jgi:hypothetical protein